MISLYRTDKLVPLAKVRIILKTARDQIQKLSPSLTHLSVCIDVIEHGIVCGPRDGLWKKAEALYELRQSNTCRSLVHIFFAQRETSKLPGITNIGLSPRNIGNIAVIGGGLIGSGIATVLVLNNFHVVLKEETEASLQNGIGRVKANLESHVNSGKMTREQFKKTCTLIKGVLSYEGFKDMDLVIEAMPDIPSSKERIFADLEKHCSHDCIFASSSSVNLNIIVQTRLHNRIVGFHLFSPLPVLSLLEIVRTEKTSSQAIVNLLNFGRKIRKTPVVFRNCSGSVVNRMLVPYFQAAFLLAEHGADVYQIDSAIASFGMPLGPFRMIDLIGFQTAIGTITKFVEDFPDRSYKSLLIPVMLKDNYEGESTGKGFYLYDDKGRNQPNPSIQKCIKEARNLSGVNINLEVKRLADEEILEMILFPVVNEACHIISEGIAEKASDLDVASVMGMGFPGYRGGIIFWSDIIGSQHICARLDDWSRKYGNFYRPSAYLMEQASKQGSLVRNLHCLRWLNLHKRTTALKRS
nr:glyoxysomal fatty acid beta-oxidation multifunctional protein MFP-A [Ipomoea batatas]